MSQLVPSPPVSSAAEPSEERKTAAPLDAQKSSGIPVAKEKDKAKLRQSRADAVDPEEPVEQMSAADIKADRQKAQRVTKASQVMSKVLNAPDGDDELRSSPKVTDPTVTLAIESESTATGHPQVKDRNVANSDPRHTSIASIEIGTKSGEAERSRDVKRRSEIEATTKSQPDHKQDEEASESEDASHDDDIVNRVIRQATANRPTPQVQMKKLKPKRSDLSMENAKPLTKRVSSEAILPSPGSSPFPKSAERKSAARAKIPSPVYEHEEPEEVPSKRSRTSISRKRSAATTADSQPIKKARISNGRSAVQGKMDTKKPESEIAQVCRLTSPQYSADKVQVLEQIGVVRRAILTCR